MLSWVAQKMKNLKPSNLDFFEVLDFLSRDFKQFFKTPVY